MDGDADMEPSVNLAAWRLRRDTLCAGDAHQRLHPLHFGFERLAARTRQAVVPPPFVARLRWRVRLLDPPGVHQPLPCPVERTGTEAHLAVGVVENVLEDAVPVPRCRREGEQDVEDRWCEWLHSQ